VGGGVATLLLTGLMTHISISDDNLHQSSLPPAVAIHNAVDAAAAIQSLVKDWTAFRNIVTVDPEAGLVSYQQGNDCVIFGHDDFPVKSTLSRSLMRFVQAKQEEEEEEEQEGDGVGGVDDPFVSFSGIPEDGLPRSFIGISQAQQVHHEALWPTECTPSLPSFQPRTIQHAQNDAARTSSWLHRIAQHT
jgi:hypothetical protein